MKVSVSSLPSQILVSIITTSRAHPKGCVRLFHFNPQKRKEINLWSTPLCIIARVRQIKSIRQPSKPEAAAMSSPV